MSLVVYKKILEDYLESQDICTISAQDNINSCEQVFAVVKNTKTNKEVNIILTLTKGSIFYADVLYRDFTKGRYYYKGFSRELKVEHVEDVVSFLNE